MLLDEIISNNVVSNWDRVDDDISGAVGEFVDDTVVSRNNVVVWCSWSTLLIYSSPCFVVQFWQTTFNVQFVRHVTVYMYICAL